MVLLVIFSLSIVAEGVHDIKEILASCSVGIPEKELANQCLIQRQTLWFEVFPTMFRVIWKSTELFLRELGEGTDNSLQLPSQSSV